MTFRNFGFHSLQNEGNEIGVRPALSVSSEYVSYISFFVMQVGRQYQSSLGIASAQSST